MGSYFNIMRIAEECRLPYGVRCEKKPSSLRRAFF
nr:MAG TPA: hypothetical protein [Caudoviricetes sp.]